MKKLLFLLTACAALCCHSCVDVEVGEYATYEVAVRLDYPTMEDEEGKEVQLQPAEGVKVKFFNSANSGVFETRTDAAGKATISLPAGMYDVSTSEQRPDGYRLVLINGGKSNVEVTSAANLSADVSIPLVASLGSNIIIKELYCGGCPKDDGSGTFSHGLYVTLYNNSEVSVKVGNICLALGDPANSNANNNYYKDGVLYYEAEGWMPAAWGFWSFRNDPEIAPGEELVIALNSAIDNTKVYSQAVNFENASYYAAYDPACGWSNAQYVLPTVIPETHYLKGYRFGAGNAWVMSVSSPAFYIFSCPENVSLQDFINDPANWNTNATGVRKLPTKWIFDGLDIFRATMTGNQKRLTKQVDAGYVNFINALGYTLYRNVNKEATEALPENKGKIVYGYNLGTEAELNGSTDPSGIDAEASIRNGARIIYMDTNNSTNDFHQRSKAALRD